MNGREEYITTNITLKKGGGDGQEEGRGPKKGERLLGCERRWGFPSLGEGTLLPGTLGHSILCVFHPQNKSSPNQSPTFRPTLYKFIIMGTVRKPRPYNWHRLWESYSCDDKCNSLLRQLNSLGETMVASLLCHKRRTARRLTAQWASGTMCVAHVPTKGQTLANLMAGPSGPRLRKVAAVRSTSRGLSGGTSFGRLVLVPSNPLDQLSGALTMANPRKAKPRSCTVLGLKPMGKLITMTSI